jgi:hypothetical protein
MFWKTFKTVCWVLAPVASIVYGLILLNLILAISLDSPRTKLFLAGFASGMIAWLFLRRRLPFFQVFDHELTHLTIGLLFFYRPHYFMASERNGMVGLYGGNFIITLAPYYLPLFSIVLMTFQPLLKTEVLPWYFAILGAITGYHGVTKFNDFRFDQPDIIKEGRLFSTLFCLSGSIIFFGVILSFVEGDFTRIIDFLAKGFETTRKLTAFLHGLIR